MRCLIIHNLRSGPRSDEIFAFAHALAQAGDEVVMRFIGDGMEPDEATRDVRTFDRVVASGGDGTVANVLDCLRDTHVPALVFPSGTANLFFNNIGNSPEIAALAAACRAGRTAPVDMGELFWLGDDGRTERHGFTIIAGSGFDATIMEKAAPAKRDIGEIAYFLSALSTLEPEVAHFSIEHDGVTEELDGISCMVGNTAVIQNGINLFPDCRMDDGLLDVIVVETSGAAQLLKPLAFGLVDRSGKAIGRPHLESFKGREVRVECSEPVPIEVDGEALPGTVRSYEARVLPAAVRIVVDAMSPYGTADDGSSRFGHSDVIAYPE